MYSETQINDFKDEFDNQSLAHIGNVKPESILIFGTPGKTMGGGLAKVAETANFAIHVVDPAGGAMRKEDFGLNGPKSDLIHHRCPISNLKHDPRQLARRLLTQPCMNAATWSAALQDAHAQEQAAPLFADASIDFAVMAFTPNYVPADEAADALHEAARVLKRNGRLVVMVVLADECLNQLVLKSDGISSMVNFPTETQFVRTLADTGLHGIRIIDSKSPVFAADGRTELRAFILEAYKGKKGECLDQGDAVIFRGPWSEVYDDDGHQYVRGERTAVCAKTYALLTAEPYRSLFIGIPARNAPPLADAPQFDCSTPRLRDPRVTKGFAALSDGVQPQACC